MDNGYMIREKNHQTLNMWAFWACQLAAQTKSIYVEKNVAQIISNCTFTLEIREDLTDIAKPNLAYSYNYFLV